MDAPCEGRCRHLVAESREPFALRAPRRAYSRRYSGNQAVAFCALARQPTCAELGNRSCERSERSAKVGGPDGSRTRDLMNAIHARSQLRYWPTFGTTELPIIEDYTPG